MQIMVGNRAIAAVRNLRLNIASVLGAFELQIYIDLVVHPANGVALRSSIIGATVLVKSKSSTTQRVGFARPESPFNVVQYVNNSSVTQTLSLLVQPAQLAAIESLRNQDDIVFEFHLSTNGTSETGEQATQEQWWLEISRSDWLDKLRRAGARDVLLLEVVLPLVEPTESWKSISRELKRAETNLRDGDFKGCVSGCRLVLDDIGAQHFGKKDWANPLLDRLGNNRGGMTSKEREGAIWAVARHFAHLSHHTESDGGVAMYSRSDAQFILSMVAALLVHAGPS